MLPRHYRLTDDKDFTRLFKRGRSAHGRGVSLRFAPNRLDRARLAFVVSTKVSKDAVVRNTLKRRMREIVRTVLPNLAKGNDIIVTAKSDAIRMEFAELKAVLLDLLRRQRLSL